MLGALVDLFKFYKNIFKGIGYIIRMSIKAILGISNLFKKKQPVGK